MATSSAQLKLSFPNPSRSFDASGHRVRFWGYDRAIEVSFFVEEDALQKLYPSMSKVEAGFLEAFDAKKKRIHEAARKVYLRGKGQTYVYSLTAEEF
jgi:hypothetical protein